MLLSADGTGEEVQELNRQNRITEQILTNFFERKFFPNRKPRPAPTIDEILPPDAKPQVPGKHKETPHGDDDELDNENLQSVESEHVDSFYRDYEGKFFFDANPNSTILFHCKNEKLFKVPTNSCPCHRDC